MTEQVEKALILGKVFVYVVVKREHLVVTIYLRLRSRVYMHVWGKEGGGGYFSAKKTQSRMA